MLPTPSTSHVSFDRVYEPAEDSYLLLDTLSSASESAFLQDRFGGPTQDPRSTSSASADHADLESPLVLEVGSGSGVVLAFLTANAEAVFGRSDVLTVGTDVNHFACEATWQTVEKALDARVLAAPETRPTTRPAFLGTVAGDLASAVRANSVDVLVFNPPYVPTESLPPLDVSPEASFDRDSRLLALSYAGGADGMETTHRLLSALPSVLKRQRGVAYVLLCARNHPDAVKAHVASWGRGWRAHTVGHSGNKAGWETLEVVRVWRTDT